MRTSDADILIVPDRYGAGADDWQTRWQQKLKTARRVMQQDWISPTLRDWVDSVVAAVVQADRPVVLIGHGLGVATIAHAAPLFPAGKVVGAFLVAPEAEPAILATSDIDRAFAPVPLARLPFRTHLVTSRNDPHCDVAQAETFAGAWGATSADAGLSGHINAASGHGPWPEGLMSFGGFLSRL